MTDPNTLPKSKIEEVKSLNDKDLRSAFENEQKEAHYHTQLRNTIRKEIWRRKRLFK